MNGFMWEWNLLYWLQTWHMEGLNQFMVGISTITAGGIIWGILALVLLLKKNTRVIGVSILIGLVFVFVFGAEGLKQWVARPRPCWLDPSVSLLVSIPKDYSFPSGHTMGVMSAAASVFYFRPLWGLAIFLIGIVVAISRMYLFVHFPTDVIGGTLFGLLFGWLGALVAVYIARRVGSPYFHN